MGASQSNSKSVSRYRFWRRPMVSTEEVERSRSSSPSSEDEEEERQSIRLSDIRTVQELYESGELKTPPETTVRYKPNVGLLDRVSLIQCDIVKLDVDAIVNAANHSLLGGGGVDGAIHAGAGTKLLDECRTLNGCETGEAKITKGYDLPARHIIHTVGPIYSAVFKEEKAQQLSSCYQQSLDLAAKNELRHIAFPSISTGIYRYPVEDATRIALGTTRTFLESEQGSKIERVIFVVWGNKDKEVYSSLIPEYFPPKEIKK